LRLSKERVERQNHDTTIPDPRVTIHDRTKFFTVLLARTEPFTVLLRAFVINATRQQQQHWLTLRNTLAKESPVSLLINKRVASSSVGNGRNPRVMTVVVVGVVFVVVNVVVHVIVSRFSNKPVSGESMP
jgi:hypothetical protein